MITSARLPCLLHRSIITIAVASACARADKHMPSNAKESGDYEVSSHLAAAPRWLSGGVYTQFYGQCHVSMSSSLLASLKLDGW